MLSTVATAVLLTACFGQVWAAPAQGKTTSSSSSVHTTTSRSSSSAYPEATYCSGSQSFNAYSLNINFDNITTIPDTVDNTIPTPYGYLYFEAFLAANLEDAGHAPGPVPYSLPNFARTALGNQVLLGNPAITTFYSGSNAVAFDLNGFYYSCSLNTVEGATSGPADCIISIGCYQGSDNSLAGATLIGASQYTYLPSSNLAVVEQASTGCIGWCKNAQFAIFTIAGTASTAGLCDTLAMQMDNVDVNVYTCS